MRPSLYTLFGIALLLVGCSKWNVADKEIGINPNPGSSTVGNVTFVNIKPIQLLNTSATVSFRVDKPQAVSEYGVILTPDPGQLNAIRQGVAAPLTKSKNGAITGDAVVNFEVTGLTENSPYYGVAYAKDAAGKVAYSQNVVSFRTKFAPRTNNWRQLASLPTQRAYSFNPLFTINGKVYVGGAAQEIQPEGYYYFKQLYEYDPETNIWAQKKDFPGTARSEATVAVLNGKGYIMFGLALGKASYSSDAWEYNPVDDSWRQLTKPPVNRPNGQGQYNLQAGAIPFVYNNRVFALFGRGTYNNDVKLTNIYNSLYALDPSGDGNWEVSFPFNDKGLTPDVIFAAARSGAFSVQYGNWVYFGGGLAASYYNATGPNLPYGRYFNSRQIWGYNAETKELKAIAVLPGSFGDCSNANDTGGRMAGFAFVVGSKAYITDCSSQMWVMDLSGRDFTPQFSTSLRHPSTTGVGVGVGNKAYFGLRNADWWEFTPN